MASSSRRSGCTSAIHEISICGGHCITRHSSGRRKAAPLNSSLCRSPTDKDPSMLRKMKSIYIESSVVSVFGGASESGPGSCRKSTGDTRLVGEAPWECELFVSEVVVEECAAGAP